MKHECVSVEKFSDNDVSKIERLRKIKCLNCF